MAGSLKWILFCFLTLLLVIAAAPALTKSKINEDNCTYEQKPLYGKVEIVESFPDLKIKAVESFPDLKVKIVESFPDDCGEWEMVESFPDIKVQFVESFPDLEIKFVDSFPGIP